MDYYRLLDFYTEPFSNSPDPEYFFGSSSHVDCLQQMEISIRLRRGLCVAMGEVGAGKTTICRKLIRDLHNDPVIEAHLILDPSFMSSLEMLGTLNRIMRNPDPSERLPYSEGGYKELIKNHLLKKVVQEKKIVVLIVDEGQKISSPCLEVLRELLNFETNEHKLLQIIIFAQNEFQDILTRHPNFADRVNFFCHLSPLSFPETRALIKYRLEKATDYKSSRRPGISFTSGAYRMIYQATKGHPRKIINLCHRLLLLLIVTNKQKVNTSLVNRAFQDLARVRKRFFLQRRLFSRAAAAMLFLLLGAGYMLYPEFIDYSRQNQAVSLEQDFRRSPAYVRIKLDPLPEVEAGNINVPGEFAQEKLNPGVEAGIIPEKRETLRVSAGQSSIPEELGQVRVRKHENLWNIMQRIYGTATISLTRRVEASNPHIRDINHLLEGQRIFLPVLEARSPSFEELYWIVLDTYTELDKAYAQLLSIDKDRLRILSYVNSASDANYCVVWLRSFPSEIMAVNEIAALPAGLRQKSQVLRLDDGDILLF